MSTYRIRGKKRLLWLLCRIDKQWAGREKTEVQVLMLPQSHFWMMLTARLLSWLTYEVGIIKFTLLSSEGDWLDHTYLKSVLGRAGQKWRHSRGLVGRQERKNHFFFF